MWKYPSDVSVSKIVSEYDQEIPQSQTADIPVAPRGRAAQPSRDTKHCVDENLEIVERQDQYRNGARGQSSELPLIGLELRNRQS